MDQRRRNVIYGGLMIMLVTLGVDALPTESIQEVLEMSEGPLSIGIGNGDADSPLEFNAENLRENRQVRKKEELNEIVELLHSTLENKGAKVVDKISQAMDNLSNKINSVLNEMEQRFTSRGDAFLTKMEELSEKILRDRETAPITNTHKREDGIEEALKDAEETYPMDYNGFPSTEEQLMQENDEDEDLINLGERGDLPVTIQVVRMQKYEGDQISSNYPYFTSTTPFFSDEIIEVSPEPQLITQHDINLQNL